MARTNAFICDRCGRTAKLSERYQIKAPLRLSLTSNTIDLCSSCYKAFMVFMDPSTPIVTKEC